MSKSKARAAAAEAAETSSEAEEEEQQQTSDSFQSVEKLQEFGINASDIAKLKTAGIYTFAHNCAHPNTKQSDGCSSWVAKHTELEASSCRQRKICAM